MQYFMKKIFIGNIHVHKWQKKAVKFKLIDELFQGSEKWKILTKPAFRDKT